MAGTGAREGWYHLAQGDCGVASDEDLDEVNRYWYFSAAADVAFWEGEPVISVRHHAFDWCVDTSGSDSRDVGLREIDIDGNDDVKLVPFST